MFFKKGKKGQGNVHNGLKGGVGKHFNHTVVLLCLRKALLIRGKETNFVELPLWRKLKLPDDVF